MKLFHKSTSFLIFIAIISASFIPIAPFSFLHLPDNDVIGVQEVDAAVRVKGYYRKDGTYVQPHYRSNPDGNPYNNWSFPGNINPYTGKVAPGNPDTYLKNYYGSSGGSSYSLPPITSPPKINAPANAYILGSSWYCNSGYKKVGNSCEKVIAPLNAYILGSNWYCNSGYVQQDNQCVDKHTAACEKSFGANTYGKAGNNNTSVCYCETGFEWNYNQTSCIQKKEIQQPYIIKKSESSGPLTAEKLQEQIDVLLAQLAALQRLLDSVR